MLILFAIKEAGNILLQICGFLSGLLLFWILVLSGSEMWKDKIKQKQREQQERERTRKEIERRKQELEKAKKRQQEKEIQIKEEKEHQDMMQKCMKSMRKNLDFRSNNYRKMHHIPLVRKGGSNYADHIDRKLKRGSR